MGGAGDSPAPVGDPPTGTAMSHVPKRPFSRPRIVVSIPSGASPDGTGGSPVLPGNHFPNTLLHLSAPALTKCVSGVKSQVPTLLIQLRETDIATPTTAPPNTN